MRRLMEEHVKEQAHVVEQLKELVEKKRIIDLQESLTGGQVKDAGDANQGEVGASDLSPAADGILVKELHVDASPLPRSSASATEKRQWLAQQRKMYMGDLGSSPRRTGVHKACKAVVCNANL